MNWRFSVIAFAVAAAFVLGLVGCGGGGTSNTGDGYKVENQQIIQKGDDAYIKGTLTNTTDKEHDIVLVWSAFDSGKNYIGSATFKANKIGANEKYEFDVQFKNAKDESVRFDAVKDFTLEEVHFLDIEEQEKLDNVGQKDIGDGFTLKNQELFKQLSDAAIKGKFVNDSGKTIKKAHIVWDLRDKYRDKYGEAEVTIQKSIADGETIEFESELSIPTNTRGEVMHNAGDVSFDNIKSFTLNEEKTKIEYE